MIAEQILINGAFEDQLLPDGTSPVGWVEDPTLPVMGHTINVAYSGKWYAQFGARSAIITDMLYQIVEMPDILSGVLSFQLAVSNTTATVDAEYNTFSVKIRDRAGSDLETLATWTNQEVNAGLNYFKAAFDISKHSGQVIQVYFTSTSTDSAKDTVFLVDDVRLDVVLRLPASAFPPLISHLSTDSLGAIQQYGDKVFCSYLIRENSDDPFFHPVTKHLTGYAWDGTYYYHGVANPMVKAAWWSEATGGGDMTTRGAIQNFPTSAIILVSEGSISILDLNDSLNMWMIFKKKGGAVYSSTFGLDSVAILTPTSVGYSGGTISVTFTPQPGSVVVSTAILNIDFTQDTVMLDLSL